MSFQAMNYAAFSCSTTKVKESKKKKRGESLADCGHCRFSVRLASSILCIGRKRPEQQSFNRRLKTDGTPVLFCFLN